MYYAQSTAKGHIRAKHKKKKVFLPQVQVLIHYLNTNSTVEDLEKFEETKVEWDGKADSR